MKLLKLFINFWKGIWNIIKSMKGWRGILSLLLVWLIISGAGLIILGYILAIPTLRTIGYSMYIFWLGSMTPLMPLTIALALIVQRFIFQDRSISVKNIKQQFKKAFEKEEKKEKEKE